MAGRTRPPVSRKARRLLKEFRQRERNCPKSNRERRIYRQGLLDAFSLVEEWDKYVLHRYRLSDCLRAKVNLLPKKAIRRHPMMETK